MGPKRARLIGGKQVARDTLLLSFDMTDPPVLEFRAGQFISLLLEDGAKRAYSIASSALRTDGFDLLVKLLAKGRASHALETLTPGHEIRFVGPTGFFVLDAVHPGDVVFCATGSGIAPVIPMLEELLGRANGDAPRVRLYFGLRHDDELVFRDELDTFVRMHAGRFSYSLHVTQPGPSYTGPIGRITQSALDFVAGAHEPVFYIVGNGDMVRDLKTGLVALGIDRKRQVRTEIFTPAAPVAKPVSSP